jgi:hypothetical protein
MEPLEWHNMKFRLAFGPLDDDDARRMAVEWAEYREAILAEEPFDARPHWCITVLDRGQEPAHEPDPRFGMLSEEEAEEFDRRQREEEIRLADVARREYESLRKGKS